MSGPPEHVESSGQEPHSERITAEFSGQRLDAYLSARFPQWSRTYFRKAIQTGDVTVRGKRVKGSHRLCTGEVVSVRPPQRADILPPAEEIPLTVLFEDEHIAVIDKPPGMVVHPGKGHWAGTLTAALVFHFEQLSTAAGPARPGLVHRLDRDTTGVILIAKTDAAHQEVSRQFQAREVRKEYLAVCVGNWDRDADLVDQPIGPHPYQREKMAIRAEHPDSKSAQTFFRVLERYQGFLLVQAEPRTGRTHQIRVHAAHLGIPFLCDRQYSGRSRITWGELIGTPGDETLVLERQALHAHRLALKHPVSGEPLSFTARIPADLARVVDLLRGPARPVVS